MKLTNNQIVVLIAIVLCIPFSILSFVDFMHVQSSQKNKLVDGQVVKREISLDSLKMKRPLLTIQLADSDVFVKASLSMDGINDVPDSVHVYYSGDPNQEVYLQEETNPLWGFVFFIVAGSLLFFMYIAKKV